MLRPTRLFTALCFVLLAWPALAQAPQGTPTRIRGAVVELAGHTLLVRSRDGKRLSLTLAPDFTVSGVVKEKLADIRNGDFVASTSIRGRLRAGRCRPVETRRGDLRDRVEKT
jgi:hypothetical protein